MKTILRHTAFTILSLILLTFSAASFSQVLSFTTTGDLCKVKNPTGREVRRDFGSLINIKSSGNYNIACPISTVYGSSGHTVAAIFENFHEDGITQSFQCTLTEYDFSNFRVRSWSQGASIPSGFLDLLLFEDIQLSDEFNRLHLICRLPPRSALGTIAVDNFL